ncbi:MAG: hypothetical protein WCK00_16360, partial [Deltaproteobacteria bacterium]
GLKDLRIEINRNDIPGHNILGFYHIICPHLSLKVTLPPIVAESHHSNSPVRSLSVFLGSEGGSIPHQSRLRWQKFKIYGFRRTAST